MPSSNSHLMERGKITPKKKLKWGRGEIDAQNKDDEVQKNERWWEMNR